jgi:hypothetical protein
MYIYIMCICDYICIHHYVQNTYSYTDIYWVEASRIVFHPRSMPWSVAPMDYLVTWTQRGDRSLQIIPEMRTGITWAVGVSVYQSSLKWVYISKKWAYPTMVPAFVGKWWGAVRCFGRTIFGTCSYKKMARCFHSLNWRKGHVNFVGHHYNSI